MFVKTQNITDILFVQSVGANILVLNFTTQNVERIKLCKVCRRETESLALKYIRYLSSAALVQAPTWSRGPCAACACGPPPGPARWHCRDELSILASSRQCGYKYQISETKFKHWVRVHHFLKKSRSNTFIVVISLSVQCSCSVKAITNKLCFWKSKKFSLHGCLMSILELQMAFSWLKAPTITFTFKTQLRHYAKHGN